MAAVPTLRLLAAMLALGLTGAQATRAQTQAPSQFFIRVATSAGEVVTDLSADEFLVKEGDIYCGVVSAELGAPPMKIALLVDNSDRIYRANGLNSLRTGLDAFLSALPPPHEVALMTIGGNVQWRVDFTTDRQELRQSASEIFVDRDSGPVMLDAIRETWERRFQEEEPWPVFVVVATDGSEISASMNEEQYNTFVAELFTREVTVHVALLSTRGGSTVTSYALNLTENTDGIYSVFGTATQFRRALTELARRMMAHHDDVSERYRVIYECPNAPGAVVSAGVSRRGLDVQLFADRRMPQ